MRKILVNSDQDGQSDQTFRRYLTPLRVMVGVVALVLLLASATGALIVTTRSYAASNTALDACTTATAVPTNSNPTHGDTPTATATPRHHRTPVTDPTEEPTDAPTQNPTQNPTQVPTQNPTQAPTQNPTQAPTQAPTQNPTQAPTQAPTQSSTHTSSSDSVMLLSAHIHLSNRISSDATAQCTSTTAAGAGTTETPDTTKSTPAASGSSPAATPINTPAASASTPAVLHNQSSSNASHNSPMAVIVGGVFLFLLISLALGWFFLRRMLLPANALSTNLPPSGARPWSRTRVPSPNSAIGLLNEQVEPGANINSNPTIAAPLPVDVPRTDPGAFASNNIIGTAGFSDGFIPPAPHIFTQETSMIPPGSGAFPVAPNGFAPASAAFNGMYGLPDDPFAGSQAGTPWQTRSGELRTPGAQATPTSGAHFAPSQTDLDDPELAEIIRQYSQKSQAVQPRQTPPSSAFPGKTRLQPEPGPDR